MSGSASTRALIGATIVLVVAACGSGAAAANSPPAASVAAPAAPPMPSPSPSPSPTAVPTASPTPSPAPGYGAAPPNWPTPAPFAPPSPLPDPPGQPIPANLIGRQYNVDPPSLQGAQAEVLTLRSADDPHCKALYEGRSTCFTVLWTPNYPKHATDPAARGSARIVDGNLVLAFDLVPNDPACEGTSATFTVSADLSTLDAIVPGCAYQRFTAH
jgi:hypothetical protein